MPDDPADAPSIRLVFESDPVKVRAALRALFDLRSLRLLPLDDRGTAEIVLAEALNNVVEHAYASGPGEIEVTIRLVRGAMICAITDHGAPMPDNVLPRGELAPLIDADDLPEGGFGWHLIRVLSQDLAYRRIDGRNQLTFRLESAQCADSPGFATDQATSPY